GGILDKDFIIIVLIVDNFLPAVKRGQEHVLLDPQVVTGYTIPVAEIAETTSLNSAEYSAADFFWRISSIASMACNK
ncbi:hypothetical protein HDU84_001256, partial [Entophlyctis sp. JEL0112]